MPIKVSEDRDALRRSVERARVRKSLFEAICEIANGICDQYQIGMCGGADAAPGA